MQLAHARIYISHSAAAARKASLSHPNLRLFATNEHTREPAESATCTVRADGACCCNLSRRGQKEQVLKVGNRGALAGGAHIALGVIRQVPQQRDDAPPQRQPLVHALAVCTHATHVTPTPHPHQLHCAAAPASHLYLAAAHPPATLSTAGYCTALHACHAMRVRCLQVAVDHDSDCTSSRRAARCESTACTPQAQAATEKNSKIQDQHRRAIG